MLRDMVVNLSIDANDDATRDYAISLARLFGAHLAGVAFAVEPVPPAILAEGGPSEWFDELMREAETSADAAVARFNEAIRGSGIFPQALRLTTTALAAGICSAALRTASMLQSFDKMSRTKTAQIPW
jgi:hypothetical protein